MYRVSDNDFGKARGRNPSKSYILVRRRGFRLITQSKIFIWKAIDRYRTFRHVARNIYTFNLDRKKMQGLVENLPVTVDLVCEDLADFVDFLNEADAHGR